jgi:UDP-N-acetylglucosamine acyltransferase
MSDAIHPTAIVHPNARLGTNVAVGPYAVIEDGVVIGEDCAIAAHAVIKRYTRMGRGNRVYEHAVIGGDPQDYKFKDCVSFVSIGDRNLIREGVTIHRGSIADAHTRIGDDCFLMANCHVAHDCTIGDGVVIANGTLLGGVVEIGDRAFVSGAVTIHQFCRVGRFALLAASTRVNQDCLPFVVTDGVPGRARGLNLVGLKRGGMPAAEIGELKRAFHVLRTASALDPALEEIAAYGSPAAAELVQFIRASKRGFAHPAS